jgi:uncharacterized protein (TIGR00304 family)
MRTRMWLPVMMFISGCLSIGYAVATGEADVSLVIIFPVFSGSGALFLLGIVLIIASFFVGFAMLAMGPPEQLAEGAPLPAHLRSLEEPRRTTKYGGVVLIGPIPIAFGSDRNLALFMLAIGIVLAAVFLVALFVLR